MADKKNDVYARFNFCGKVSVSRKAPMVKRDTLKTSEKISINFGIKAGTNMGYVKLEGFKNDVIKTFDPNMKSIEVDWADRFDEDVIKNVSSIKKLTVNLGERKEFITEWDMIEYLESALTGYEDDIVVTGQFVLRPGTGKYSDQVYREFQIQNVYMPSEKDTPHLTMNLDLYYDKDSMDKSSLKDDGKIFMHCYTPMYSKVDNARKMFSIDTVFNTAVFDMSKPKHKAIYDYKMRYLETKSRNPVHMNWQIAVVNGAEEVEFTMDSLTEQQKEQVELGISKMEDFKPRGNIFGERVNELRLVKPILTGEFEECKAAADSEYTAREFEDEIYAPASDESVDDMVSGSSKSKTKAKTAPAVEAPAEDEEDIDSMF